MSLLSWIPVEQRQRSLYQSWITVITLILNPKTKRQVQVVLGTSEYFYIWIQDFEEMARFLYMSTKWDTEPITQTERKQKMFETLITTLRVGSDPGLPDVSKTLSSACVLNKRHYKRCLNPNFGVMIIPCDIFYQMIIPCSHRMA